MPRSFSRLASDQQLLVSDAAKRVLRQPRGRQDSQALKEADSLSLNRLLFPDYDVNELYCFIMARTQTLRQANGSRPLVGNRVKS